MAQTIEHDRLTGDQAGDWRRWGSYLADRCWGTVRESGDTAKAWKLFPFDHAHSRAFRWSEDGIGGFSDIQQRLCLTSAFWNGQDPILKERFYGLSNEQGNHGEDVKEYYFFVDGLPSHSYMKMVYRYPQAEFPYQRLIDENALRGQDQPPYQLIDALPNTFEAHRFFEIVIEFAKADADDLLYRITATNCGDRPAPLHILPQLFFRNTWGPDPDHPRLAAEGASTVIVDHPDFAGFRWYVESEAKLLFTENMTNIERLYDGVNDSPYTKDGIDYAVVRGQPHRVNPARAGSKCAAHHQRTLAPQESWVVRSRLSPNENPAPFADFDAIVTTRQQEADEFYRELQHTVASDEKRRLQRAAFAGLNWNNLFYNFNVQDWMQEFSSADDDKSENQPFRGWEHFDAHDILSVPDPWEYPWLAAWDLSFQIVTLAMLNTDAAKQQALLLINDRYMHANGAVPAFEGDLETPHPPVYAWAVWHIHQGSPGDQAFLKAAYEPLKRHFAWWLENHQTEDHRFDGGFLGKDNISIVDRNKDIPEGGYITQVDSSGWMAFFTLHMLAIAVELARDEDADYFLSEFLSIRTSLQQLWDEKDRFFFDVICTSEGERIPLKVRSLVGLIPLIAAMRVDPRRLDTLPTVRDHLTELSSEVPDLRPNKTGEILLAVLPQQQIKLLLKVLLNPEEFLSPYGLRSLSKIHAEQPVKLKLGDKTFELEYTPGYSKDEMFGGNSNWRGPIWPPLNQVFIEALYTYADYFQSYSIQRNNQQVSLDEATHELVERLLSIFGPDQAGHRPYLGSNLIFQGDSCWHDMFWFHEHFHADTGEGLGAQHQNGWTSFVAILIHNQGRGRLALCT